ncbi:MAG TPA: hypothetical protein VF614_14835, partial [Chthoniobacteraceae bacterium]
MSAFQNSSSRREGVFWQPFHLAFRWPLRVAGLLLVGWFASEAIQARGYPTPALLNGLFFFLSSFATPTLRRRTHSDRFAFRLLIVALAAVVFVFL